MSDTSWNTAFYVTSSLANLVTVTPQTEKNVDIRKNDVTFEAPTELH